MGRAGNLQRAFWTFLAYTLIAPFLAGLGVAAAMVLSPLVGLDVWLPKELPNVGITAMATYVWSALPAALAGLAMFILVWRTGTFGVLAAAVAGIGALAIAFAFSNMPHREFLMVLAFFAGLVSLGVRQALIAGGIIARE